MNKGITTFLKVQDKAHAIQTNPFKSLMYIANKEIELTKPWVMIIC